MGIWFLEDFTKMAQNNLTPLINSIRNLLANWIKLKLSWMGRVAAIKMVILPRFLFLFQNLLVKVPDLLLQKTQCIFNDFIWNGQ